VPHLVELHNLAINNCYFKSLETKQILHFTENISVGTKFSISQSSPTNGRDQLKYNIIKEMT